MSSYQQVIVCGNLGNDPEARTLTNGTEVSNVSVATSETWTKDGQKQERTEWHRCVGFNKVAEIMNKYLRKGTKVLITGQLRTRKWQAQDGSDRYSTEIVVRDMKMLSPRENGSQSASHGRSGQSAPPPAQDFGDFDDDIPF